MGKNFPGKQALTTVKAAMDFLLSLVKELAKRLIDDKLKVSGGLRGV